MYLKILIKRRNLCNGYYSRSQACLRVMLQTAVLSRISGCKGNWNLFMFSASKSATTFVRPCAQGICCLHRSREGYLELPMPAGSRRLSQCWQLRAMTQCCPLKCTPRLLPADLGNNLMTAVSSQRGLGMSNCFQ